MLLNDIFDITNEAKYFKDQVRGTEKAKTIKPQPHKGSQPHPFQGRLVGGESKINELDTRSEDNFTIDDIKQIERLDNLNDIKQKAIELITKPSKRPISIEKQRWLKNAVMDKKNKIAVIKLMYDLMLGGEGMKVIGSKSNYRQKFGEDANPTDKVTMDIPLFLRMMEYAKEDAKTDMDLHDVTERAIELMKQHDYLCMDNYNDLVGGEATGGEQPTNEFKDTAKYGDDSGKNINHEIFQLLKSGATVYSNAVGRMGKVLRASNDGVVIASKRGKGFTSFNNGDPVKIKQDGNKPNTYHIVNLMDEAKKKITAKNDPCWSGYHMVGTKKKNGREVPNCVPGKKGD